MGRRKKKTLDITGGGASPTLTGSIWQDGALVSAEWFQISCIIVFGLLAHGILALTDYVMWDSLIIGHLVESPNLFGVLSRWASDGGRPHEAVFYLPFVGSSNVVLAGKITWIVIYILTFIVLKKTLPLLFGFSRTFSFAICAVAVVMPFYETIGELQFVIHAFPLFLFWLSWYLYGLLANQKPVLAVIGRLASMTGLWFAFQMNSLLAFQYGILFLYLAHLVIRKGDFSLKFIFLRLFQITDMGLLPIVFWFHKKWFCPIPSGSYHESVGYNQISKDLTVYIDGFFQTFSGVFDKFGSVFDTPLAAILFIGSTLIGTFIYLFLRALQTDSRLPWRMILLSISGGFLLLFLAIFPYVAVGKPYGAFSYDSRNGVLLAMPIAMILVGALVGAQQLWLEKFAPISRLAILTLCCFGIVENNRNYLRLQGYGVKQDSFAMKVKEIIQKTPDVAVVHLREYFQFPKTPQWIPAVSWTYKLADQGKLPEVLVVDTRNFLPDKSATDNSGKIIPIFPKANFSPQDVEHFCWLSSQPYGMKNIKREGLTINLAALEGKSRLNAEKMGLIYIYKKFTQPSTLDIYIKNASEIIKIN